MRNHNGVITESNVHYYSVWESQCYAGRSTSGTPTHFTDAEELMNHVHRRIAQTNELVPQCPQQLHVCIQVWFHEAHGPHEGNMTHIEGYRWGNVGAAHRADANCIQMD